MDQDVIDYRFNFFGYGDLASPLWFIGIEEGGDLHSNAVFDSPKIPGTHYFYDPNMPTKAAQLWGVYRNIARAVGASSYFMSNMGAIAKPTDAGDRSMLPGDYTALVRQGRIPVLRQLIERYRPRAVVFHGKGAWTRYAVREAFELDLRPGSFHAYAEERLLFTPFLQRLRRADRAKLEAALRALLSDT